MSTTPSPSPTGFAPTVQEPNNRGQHAVWDVYDDYRSAMMNVRIQKCCIQKLRRQNYFVEIPLAIIASSTVAGLWFWKGAAGGEAWKYLGGLAAFLAVMKPIMRIPDKIQERGEMLVSLSVIENELEKLVKKISHDKIYDETLFERYNKILDMKGEHKKKYQTAKYQQVSKRLKRRCGQEVEVLYPGTKFYVPEE
ncbi:MAG: hypothetical protein QOH70_3602 [Blastocatellia bacterium]|nr:hypothetical protein [Blastocatellia bacterium]